YFLKMFLFILLPSTARAPTRLRVSRLSANLLRGRGRIPSGRRRVRLLRLPRRLPFCPCPLRPSRRLAPLPPPRPLRQPAACWCVLRSRPPASGLFLRCDRRARPQPPLRSATGRTLYECH